MKSQVIKGVVFYRFSKYITSYTLKVSMYNDPQKEGKPER